MNQIQSLRHAIQGAIRVLVVDDSAFMRTTLSRMISSESGLDVTGTAAYRPGWASHARAAAGFGSKGCDHSQL